MYNNFGTYATLFYKNLLIEVRLMRNALLIYAFNIAGIFNDFANGRG